jgi:protein-tyrosine phosphatase
MTEEYPYIVTFENIPNFRDLGGYRAGRGKKVALGRLYRSGALVDMTAPDKARLKNEIRLKTAIDVTTPQELKKTREIRLLEEIGVRYFNIPFRPDVPNYYQVEMAMYVNHSTMGAVYLERMRNPGFGRKLIGALEMIANPAYHPLVFHCSQGKDRTGILAAMVLSLLGVGDEDIIRDYNLSDSSSEEVRSKIVNDPSTREEIRNLPDYCWRAVPESIKEFLAGLKQAYGSAEGYLKLHSADKTLIKRLEKTLLVT